MDFKLNNVVSMWKFREIVDKANNLVMSYTETESKVSFQFFMYLDILCVNNSKINNTSSFTCLMILLSVQVRDATNEDPWFPSGAQMQQIASYTYTYKTFPEVMEMLWKRLLQDNRSNWRRTYKSLLLLDYLIKNGNERVVTAAREHIYDLRNLENYRFVDHNGKF